MPRGIHGEKIVAVLENTKLPKSDKPRVEVALQKYDEWARALDATDAPTVDELIEKTVNLLNLYKFYIDVNLILAHLKVGDIGDENCLCLFTI